MTAVPDTVTASTTAIATAGADATEVPRILFVDDDDSLLDGLRDALRPYRRRWAMTFAGSAEEALERLDADAADVVICDLRMPEMDGATLLEQVRRRTPSAVRIVLSGHAELRLVARAAGVAHQLLSKPCETDHLVEVIERACALRHTIAGMEMSHRAAGASSLPSVPHLYLELSQAVESGEATVEQIARIVEQDIGMAAKILQLANSAYFGRRQPVSAIRSAVAYLGLDAVEALVLQTDTFRQFSAAGSVASRDLDRLQRHCVRVGRLAGDLLAGVRHESSAFTAGLLHDVGLLILASQDSEQLSRTLARAHAENRAFHEVERELAVVGHAELGAHLLALWGLPFPVTAAVAAHHTPPDSEAPVDEGSAIYAANVLVEEAEAAVDASELPPSQADLAGLERGAFGSRLAELRERARATVETTQ